MSNRKKKKMAEWDLICVHGCVKIYDYWFSRLLKIFCWHLFFFFFLSWVCLFFLFYNVYVIKTHFQIIFMFPFLWNFSVIFFLHIFAIYFIYLWLFYRLKIINLKKIEKPLTSHLSGSLIVLKIFISLTKTKWLSIRYQLP